MRKERALCPLFSFALCPQDFPKERHRKHDTPAAPGVVAVLQGGNQARGLAKWSISGARKGAKPFHLSLLPW